MPFIPTTDENRKEMLKTIGVSEFDELLQAIPKESRFKGCLDLPDPLSEYEVTKLLGELAAKNEHSGTHTCFLGGGAYDHFVPAAIDYILNRSEFYTAYTPYQPEVSQGNLQAIYEYQTMISNLTGMDIANASMYDGATAIAEAALLASTQMRREEIIMSKTIHPFYRQVVETYCHRSGIQLKTVEEKDGQTDLDNLKSMISEKTAGVLIQHPNFLGNLEDVDSLEKIIHDTKALFVVSVDPISLGVLKPPGSYNADVATGEGQAMGNALNFGGPFVGIFTVKKELVRRLPGRLVGVTQDTEGKRGFVLTLQTREQHIRREKATSSICTNEQLCALASTVYMALMGKSGVPQVAKLSLQKAHYLADQLEKAGVKRFYNHPFFKEFAIQCPVAPKKIIKAMREKNIFAGVDLSRFDYGIENGLLIAVTEKRTKQEMDLYVEAFQSVIG